MKYLWNSRKPSGKQHLCDDNGLTYCKAENGSWRFETLSVKPHERRLVCSICKHMVAKQRKAAKAQTPKKAQSRYNDLFLRTWEWKQVRYLALKRSNGCCALCGRGAKDSVILNVDHIKPRKKHPELALTLSNLQVLCGDCNHGKGNQDETDWREPRLATLMGEAIEDA